MKTIALMVGTRPEAIKMAPIHMALKDSPHLNVRLVAVAQHRQLLDQVLEVFDIKPDVDLDIMQANQTLVQVSVRILSSVQRVLAEMQPDAVLVHGDTSTCLFSAIAAFYERIPVGHVEAGLRTYDFNKPWPEEMNRRLADPISKWCFAPTERAATNLRNEGIPSENIFITGNTVIDALLYAKEYVRRNPPTIAGDIESWIGDRQLILVTGHRRESFGQPFREFCLALRELVEANKNTVIIYPVHLNPNVREPVNSILSGCEQIKLIEPVDYLSFVYLMDRCRFALTDSGGVQEEAPSLGKPVLVARDTTERPEAIEAGLACLVGMDREKILSESHRLLNNPDAYSRMAHGDNPYGCGNSAQQIVDILAKSLGE